jgi:hypothetical protein
MGVYDYLSTVAKLNEAAYQGREAQLGDPGKSYGGGNLAQAANAAPVIPAGRGPETGKWENVEGGLQATAGDGTFNRPAHREVVGAGEGPVHVIRGTRSSYAGGAPGEEWRSLSRASQAVNRAAGVGEHVPSAGEQLQLAQAAAWNQSATEAQGKAQEAGQAKNLTAFDTLWKNSYASPTPKKTGAGYDYTMPTDAGTIKDYLAAKNIAGTQGPEAGLQHFQESQNFRKYEPLFSNEGILGSHGISIPAEVRTNPELWRQTVLQFGSRLQPPTTMPRSVGRNLWEGTPGQGQVVP